MGRHSNGGMVGPQNLPEYGGASGIYDLATQQTALGAGTWPGPAVALTMKLWGAGGGAGSKSYSSGNNGSQGGFLYITWFAIPGTVLDINVGQGGLNGGSSAYGNGGAGDGGGGGATWVRLNGTSTYLAVAGAGGGRNPNCYGGGTSGGGVNNGGCANNGGTQSAGGCAPVGGFGGGGSGGTAGSFLTGGTGSSCAGGGGGAGWYGGGGGQGDCGASGGGGGGGGSSYVNTSLTVGSAVYDATVTYNTNGMTSVATSDSNYVSPIGLGGTSSGATGKDGRIVLISSTGTVTAFTYVGSVQTYTVTI